MYLAFEIVTVPRLTPMTVSRLKVLGREVESIAKSLCPVDTGALKRSIRTYLDGNSLVIEADEDYASFVEYGTIKQDPQPFLQPAILATQAEILDTVVESQKDFERVIRDIVVLNAVVNSIKQ